MDKQVSVCYIAGPATHPQLGQVVSIHPADWLWVDSPACPVPAALICFGSKQAELSDTQLLSFARGESYLFVEGEEVKELPLPAVPEEVPPPLELPDLVDCMGREVPR